MHIPPSWKEEKTRESAEGRGKKKKKNPETSQAADDGETTGKPMEEEKKKRTKEGQEDWLDVPQDAGAHTHLNARFFFGKNEVDEDGVCRRGKLEFVGGRRDNVPGRKW